MIQSIMRPNRPAEPPLALSCRWRVPQDNHEPLVLSGTRQLSHPLPVTSLMGLEQAHAAASFGSGLRVGGKDRTHPAWRPLPIQSHQV